MSEYDHLETITKIDNATRKIQKLEGILDDISTEVKNLEFDFVTIQMINKEAKTVETVYGKGLTPHWFTIARHSIIGDPVFWDIQAEIVMHDPPRIEILSGYDRRFDKYIFEKFGHKNLVRVFVPIILTSSEVPWENLRWEELKDLLPNVDQPSADDHRTVLQIRNEDWVGARGWDSQVIGTIEAGFYDPSRRISQCKALRTAMVAAKRASNLYHASLENVLATISQAAITIIGANAASLYFVRDDTQTDPKLVHYIYEACEGFRFLSSPASGALGQQALRTRKSLVIPDKKLDQDEQYLREFDRAAYDSGLRAVATIPIVYNEDSDELFADERGDALKLTKEGLLYIGFDKPHWFTDDEITRLELLANRATDAIRDATNYTKTRDRARWLANIREIVQSLADDQRSTSILDEIAGATLNILAADIVSVYEYDEREKRLLSDRSTIAGRLFEPSLINSPVVDELSAPAQLLKTGENIYVEDAASHAILAAKRGSDAFEKSFVARERVRSAAAVILRTPKEILGLMFVNYRILHHFTAEDRQVIETAASIFAIALLDRRMRAIEERLESRLRKAFNEEAEPEMILQNVFAELREIVEFDIATYVEYHAGADETAPTLARARFAIDGSEPFTWPARWVEIDTTLVKWMKGSDRLIPDLNEFYNTKAGAKELQKNPVALQYKKRGAHSVVNVPRIDGDRLLGAFSLARRKDKPAFSSDERDRLDRLGMGRIMRLVSEKLQVRHQQLAASVAGLFDLDSKTPLTEIANNFVNLIGQGFGWEYVAIFRVARVRGRFEVVAQYDATGGKLRVEPDYSQPLECGMIGKTRREGVALRARNVRPPRPKPEGWESPHGYIRTNKAQFSAMCVPVKLGQEVEWILDCESTQIDGFLQPDEDAIVNLVKDIERTIRLWFESRLSNALLNLVDQGVVVVDEHQRIERLNAAARQLLGGDPLVGHMLADFAANEAARQVLASPDGLPASGLRIKLRGDGGRENLVLASARVPEDTFNRRIWLFSDLAAKQWIVDLDHMREAVQDVAAQTRGPLLLANALVRQAGHLVSSGAAGQLAKDILERAARSLNKTDITYERLASSLEVIREPQRETRVEPFSMHSALGALTQSLPAEDKAALKLDVPPRLPLIQADSERMAFALRSIVGYLLSIRSPDANVELRAWTDGAGVSLRAAIRTQIRPPSQVASAPALTMAAAEQSAMAAERALTTARKIVESHGGKLLYRVSANMLEVELEKLPASDESGMTS